MKPPTWQFYLESWIYCHLSNHPNLGILISGSPLLWTKESCVEQSPRQGKPHWQLRENLQVKPRIVGLHGKTHHPVEFQQGKNPSPKKQYIYNSEIKWNNDPRCIHMYTYWYCYMLLFSICLEVGFGMFWSINNLKSVWFLLSLFRFLIFPRWPSTNW